MNPERWQQIADVFHTALRREASERALFLNEACAGDEELRREVEAMLASHEQASRFIEEPAMQLAARQGADGSSLTGQTIAHYQVLSLLGSGGMGDVYLALDTKLGRHVALKLLPEYLAGNTQRARQFTKEARAASALNHPNIITIHEIGQVGDRYYIAMEYVEGETLRSHIYRDKTPLPKLLKYLQQVAEGLTKAHANGIVHRDLKPDNIMITRDGYAKILDFGLAKLIERPQQTGAFDRDEAATALMAPTSIPGMVMGTLGYMSPEQAQGKTGEIDHRSDIFSFGCILYEAASGKKAFEGADVLDSLHRIVHAPTPQIREVSPRAPADLERIVRRCLMKDPEKRYQSIKDVAIELEELQHELGSEVERRSVAGDNALSAGEATQTSPVGLTASSAAQQTSSAEYLVGEIKRHRVGAAIALIALALAIGSGTFFWYKFFGKNRNTPLVSVQVGKVDRLTMIGKALDAAISPDGKFVVYVLSEAGEESLWTRDVATNSNVQIVPPAEVHYRGMTFSPDGNYVYYLRLEKNNMFSPVGVVYQVPKLGGATKQIIADATTPVTFSPDGKRLAFVRSSPDEDVLMLTNPDGTGEQKLAMLKSPDSFSGGGRGGAAVPGGGPAWSPDGKVIACPARIMNLGGLSVVEVRVADGAIKPITAKGWSTIDRVEWLRDGTGLIICALSTESAGVPQIWYLAYPGGESQMITHDLNQYGDVSLTADSSTLVSVQVDFLSNVWVVGFNQATTNARQITNGKMDGYCGISWTPDGKIVYAARKIKYADLWMMDADGGNQKQLMDDEPTDRFPSVTPDSRYIVFDSIGRGAGIWRIDSDGGNRKRLTERGQAPHTSLDGKWVTYQQGVPLGSSVWKVSIDGGQPVRLTDKLTSRPAFSPDGKQIACLYREDRTSPIKIAILPSEGGEPIKVFDNPVNPSRLFFVFRWTPDGRTILYADERGGVGNIWSQPVDGGKPAQVTDFKSDLIYTFDLSRDGKWLAVTRGTVTGDVVMMSLTRQ
jgi:serine/threonine protein kinase/Tol biopolymer transport system component